MVKKASVKGLPRVEVIDILTKVSPGLASSDLIPVLTHFWLSGDTVTTYNDRIAVEHPLVVTGDDGDVIEGALPGNLLSVLKNSRARDVSFSNDSKGGEDVVLVKAASTKIRMPSLPTDAFSGLFEMPDSAEGVRVSFKKSYPDFLNALGPLLCNILIRRLVFSLSVMDVRVTSSTSSCVRISS
jgi:hypothetical protein